MDGLSFSGGPLLPLLLLLAERIHTAEVGAEERPRSSGGLSEAPAAAFAKEGVQTRAAQRALHCCLKSW